MLARFLNLLAEPNVPRRYVGRHRAPDALRYVPVVRLRRLTAPQLSAGTRG